MGNDRLFEVSWEEALRQIRAALDARKGEWPEIAKKARVGYPWLRTFADAVHPSTDARRVGRLAQVLGLPIMVSIVEVSTARKAPSRARGRAAARP
jgi:hypothetical protein